MTTQTYNDWLKSALASIDVYYLRLRRIKDAEWREMYDAGYSPANACLEMQRRGGLR